jgi:hypothetical protein
MKQIFLVGLIVTLAVAIGWSIAKLSDLFMLHTSQRSRVLIGRAVLIAIVVAILATGYTIGGVEGVGYAALFVAVYGGWAFFTFRGNRPPRPLTSAEVRMRKFLNDPAVKNTCIVVALALIGLTAFAAYQAVDTTAMAGEFARLESEYFSMPWWVSLAGWIVLVLGIIGSFNNDASPDERLSQALVLPLVLLFAAVVVLPSWIAEIDSASAEISLHGADPLSLNIIGYALDSVFQLLVAFFVGGRLLVIWLAVLSRQPRPRVPTGLHRPD